MTIVWILSYIAIYLIGALSMLGALLFYARPSRDKKRPASKHYADADHEYKYSVADYPPKSEPILI